MASRNRVSGHAFCGTGQRVATTSATIRPNCSATSTVDGTRRGGFTGLPGARRARGSALQRRGARSCAVVGGHEVDFVLRSEEDGDTLVQLRRLDFEDPLVAGGGRA